MILNLMEVKVIYCFTEKKLTLFQNVLLSSKKQKRADFVVGYGWFIFVLSLSCMCVLRQSLHSQDPNRYISVSPSAASAPAGVYSRRYRAGSISVESHTAPLLVCTVKCIIVNPHLDPPLITCSSLLVCTITIY